MRHQHLAILALLASSLLLSCNSRNTEEKDLTYDRFLSSVVDVPYDRMVFAGQDSLWRTQSPYVYVCYADSVTCSSCLATHLSVWQAFDEQLAELSDSCHLCLVIPGDSSTVETVNHVLFYTQYHPTLYVDTAGLFLQSNPLVDSLRLLRTFLMDKDGHVLLVGDPTRRNMKMDIRKALGQEETK